MSDKSVMLYEVTSAYRSRLKGVLVTSLTPYVLRVVADSSYYYSSW